MSEVETQENQKTVVAFITGLLIGGLLVWVFSSTPEGKTKETPNEEAKTEVSQNDSKNESTKTETISADVIGEGSVVVADQKAGKTISLGETKFPTKKGWVVVRDYANNKAGNILGAARYSSEEGLAPKTVELMRDTVANSTYQVVFYTNNGDTGFKLGEDTVIDGIATTFKAN